MAETGKAMTLWQQKLAARAQRAVAAAATAMSGIPRLGFRAGIMTFKGNTIKGSKIECVILDWSFEHAWFKDDFDPNNPQNPDCFGFSKEDEKAIVPDPNGTYVQNDGNPCVSCPHYQWESDRKGGKGKDCKSVVRLVLIAANDLDEAMIGKAELVLASVPVTSVKGWLAYVNDCKEQHNSDPMGVITEISCRPDPDVQVVVEFKAVASITEDEGLMEDLFKKEEAAAALSIKPYEKNDPDRQPARAARRPGKAGGRGRR